MLTVELVAVLGVMAGAQPEHMPLLLATIDAMKAPEAAWRGTSTTTAPTSPLIVISGPIVEKLKLNAGTGTAGGENPVTNALGYFVNLVGDVVGGSVPPNFDKSTQGSSFDLVANVICENAKETPWDKTFAEEQGFTRDDSVVTISTSYLANANIDHDSVASEDLLNTFSAGIAGSASGIASCLTVTVPDEKSPYNKPLSAWSNSVSYAVLVISPEHAATMYRDMKSKDAIRDYLVKNTVLPYKFYTKATCVPPEAFGPYDANTLIPRFTQRESIKDDRLRRAGQAVPVLGAFPAGPEARFREDRRITLNAGALFTGAPALFSERAQAVRQQPGRLLPWAFSRIRGSGSSSREAPLRALGTMPKRASTNAHRNLSEGTVMRIILSFLFAAGVFLMPPAQAASLTSLQSGGAERGRRVCRYHPRLLVRHRRGLPPRGHRNHRSRRRRT